MPLKLKYSLIAAFLLGVWGLHTYDKDKAVEAAKSVLMAEYNKKLLKATEQTLEIQTKLQEDADKMKEQKDAQIEDVNRKLANTLSELRKRPSRPAKPQNTSIRSSCTGRELYREDGEFLTREAARANRVLAERDYYYNQYESVRRRMEEATN